MRQPEETKQISATSGFFKADVIARQMLDDTEVIEGYIEFFEEIFKLSIVLHEFIESRSHYIVRREASI